MNDLVQLDSLLIGDEHALKELEEKEEAQLLIISDSHGSADRVQAIIEEFGHQSDALIFCGDGAWDIAAYLEEAGRDEDLQEALPPIIALVRGNGDNSEYTFSLNNEEEKKEVVRTIHLPQRLLFSVAGRNIFVAHGDKHGVEEHTDTLASAAYAMDADMVFFGHTHAAYSEERDGTLILNPGSCFRSRTSLPESFALVQFPGEQERYHVEFYAIKQGNFRGYSFEPLIL